MATDKKKEINSERPFKTVGEKFHVQIRKIKKDTVNLENRRHPEARHESGLSRSETSGA